MTKIRKLILVSISAVFVLIAGFGVSEAAHSASTMGGGNPADQPWYLQTVEATSGAEVGQYASLAFHPASARPYISHYDATHQELHLSYPVDTGGNCGTNNGWYCEVVDTNGDVGQYSSIDLYYNGATNDRKIGIAYHDETNGALKTAIWSCSIIGNCGWKLSTIQAADSLGLFKSGFYPTLKFDSTGMPHISYYTSSYNFVDTSYALMYAHFVGSGGNCGEGTAAGQWQCDMIDYDLDERPYPSLDLTTDTHPVIAYHYPPTTSAPGQIRLCTQGGTWDCIIIDDQGGDFPSLAVDANNHAQIAYYNAYEDALKYANYVGSGGNCGLNTSTSQYEYQCETIASVGSIGPWSISLSTDMTSPIIAYQNDSDPLGFPTLDIARPITVYPGQLAGNCGPLIGVIPQWQCDTLDDANQGGGGGHLYEADYVAAAVDLTGLAAVAYYEYDDYYDEGRLKIAYQQRECEIFLPLTRR